MPSQSLERTQQDSHGSYLSVTWADALGKKRRTKVALGPKLNIPTIQSRFAVYSTYVINVNVGRRNYDSVLLLAWPRNNGVDVINLCSLWGAWLAWVPLPLTIRCAWLAWVLLPLTILAYW